MAGEITVAFRRWSSPEARAGSEQAAEVGVVAVTGVCEVDPDEITEVEARRAGFRSVEGLRASLDRHGRGRVYRLDLEYRGGAPAAGGEETVVLGRRERAELDRSLARLDTSGWRGRWTRPVLERLWERPGTRAAELAELYGRPVSRIKSDVFKLGELGLVDRSPGGYRLSPRGRAYLDGDR